MFHEIIIDRIWRILIDPNFIDHSKLDGISCRISKKENENGTIISNTANNNGAHSCYLTLMNIQDAFRLNKFRDSQFHRVHSQ